jgi:hypothetical protein
MLSEARRSHVPLRWSTASIAAAHLSCVDETDACFLVRDRAPPADACAGLRVEC